MALDLSNTLVIGISATALFDMSESDQIFKKTSESDPDNAIEKYREYMLKHEDEALQPGTGHPLVKALLDLNKYQRPEDKSPLVEVVVMSRNSTDTGLQVLNTIRHDNLSITRSAFTAGESVPDYLDAFDVVRLSPAAKLLAIAQCDNEETKQKLQNIHTIIEHNPVGDTVLSKIGQALTLVPPLAFDVSRQVRVYNAYLQYVEVSMTGAAIQRQKIAMPKRLQSVGTDNNELEGRFKTTFDLLAKGNALSSSNLEKELKDIRDKFTSSLGKDKGRVLLKRNKVLFLKRIDALKIKLQDHADNIKLNLQNSINESKESIASIYVAILKTNDSEDMKIELGSQPPDEIIKVWVLEQLDGVFPLADSLISKMEIRYEFKDMTFETLNNGVFLDNVKKAFKYENWKKAYQESIAAAGEDRKGGEL